MIIELQNLIILQSVDDKIKVLEAQLNEIPEEITALEEQKQAKQKEVENNKEAIEEQRKIQRKLEANLEDNEERLMKLNVQLNQLKSNNEYRNMLKQIDSIKEQNSEIESAILETFEEIDSRKIDLKKFRQEVDEFCKKVDETISHKKMLQKEKQEELDELRFECKSIRQDLSEELLNRYDKLINQKKTPPVVPIEGEICGGCYLTIRPAVLIDIKKNDAINYCEKCFRFLYFQEYKDEEEKA